MSGFGQLVPGMAPMPIPAMKSNGLQGMGMNILKSALAAQAKGGMGGAGGAAPGAPMNIMPQGVGQPGAPGGPPGLLGALMAKLQPQGAPMVGLPDMGGMGPAPNAISGLW